MKKQSKDGLFEELDTCSTLVVGVDLGRNDFTASIGGNVRVYTRDERGIDKLFRRVRSAAKRAAERDAQEGRKRVVVVYESAAYGSHLFTAELIKKKLDWVCLDTQEVKRYAKHAEGSGQQIKPDEVDARVIEAYARSLLADSKLRVDMCITENIRKLQSIKSVLDTLRRNRQDTEEKLQVTFTNETCRHVHQRMLSVYDKAIKEFEAHAMEILNTDANLRTYGNFL